MDLVNYILVGLWEFDDAFKYTLTIWLIWPGSAETTVKLHTQLLAKFQGTRSGSF